MNYKNIYSLIFIYYFVCFFTNNNNNNDNVVCTHQITKTKTQDNQHIYKLIQNSLLSPSNLLAPPSPSTSTRKKRYLNHEKITESLPESITTTSTAAIISKNSATKRISKNGDNFNDEGNDDDDEDEDAAAVADVRRELSSSLSFNEDDESGKLPSNNLENYYEKDNDNYDDDNDNDSSSADVEENEKDLIHALMKGTSCRTEWGIELPFDTYVLDTCARCYHYMPDTAFKFGTKFSYLKYGHLFHPELNTTLASNETLLLSHTFNSISMVFKWQQCCTDAILCCVNHFHKFGNNQIDNNDTNQNDEKNFNSNKCPPTWDGWLCWDEYAQPNQLMERPCPKHIYWHQRVPPCRGYVTKLCNSTGHWYSNSDQREWSNYTMCARDDIYARRIRYSLITNIISMLALIPALIIFIHYKQVSSISRIRLHKHLFTSLLFHSIISALLKWHLLQGSSLSDDVHNNPEDDNLFAQNHQKSSLLPSHFSSSSSSSLSLLTKSSTSSSGLLYFSSSNETISTSTDTTTSSLTTTTLSTFDRLPPFCLILSIMQRYFRSTTYLWMFNEALYLHQLIRHAFTQPSLRPLIILAYTLPFITTTSYIIARSYFLQLITMNSNTKSNTNSNDMIPPPMMFSSPSSFGINDTAQWSETPSLFFSVFEHPTDEDYVDDLTAFNYSSPLPIHLVSIKNSQRKLLSFKSSKQKYFRDKFNISSKRTIRWSDYYYLNQNYDYNNEPNNNVPNHDDIEEVNTESFVEENNFAYVDEDQCWLMPSIQPWHEWIINGPNLAILIINCFFLVWLLRVLCIKAAASALASPPPPLSLNSDASNCGSIHRQQQQQQQHSHQSGSIKSRHYRQSDTSSLNTDNSKNTNKNLSFKRTISNGSGSVSASNNNNNETTGSTSTTSFTKQPTTSTGIANQQHVNQTSSTASTSSRLVRHYHRPSSILFNRQSFLVSLRAAVLLLPLYGLHYLFIVSRPKIQTCWLSETYHYLSSSFDGLQGLMVAIIFCFANSEIRILLKRSIQRVSNRQRSLTIYMTEVGQPTTTVNQD